MDYLRIKNWDKFQHYHNNKGTPKWIKLYVDLMIKPSWFQLSDSEKGQLVCIWMVGAGDEGRVPNNAVLLKRVAGLTGSCNTNRFIELGFLEYCSIESLEAGSRESLAPIEENRREENRIEEKKNIVDLKTKSTALISEFEIYWNEYCQATGTNDNKKLSLKYWLSSVKSADDIEKYEIAVNKYIAYVQRERDNGFEELRYKGGKTWFNNWRDWVDYRPPVTKERWEK